MAYSILVISILHILFLLGNLWGEFMQNHIIICCGLYFSFLVSLDLITASQPRILVSQDLAEDLGDIAEMQRTLVSQDLGWT